MIQQLHVEQAGGIAEVLCQMVVLLAGADVSRRMVMVQLTFAEDCDAEKIAEKAKKKGMTFLEVEKNRMLLTCAGVSAEKYEDAMKLLRECTEKRMN